MNEARPGQADHKIFVHIAQCPLIKFSLASLIYFQTIERMLENRLTLENSQFIGLLPSH
jgi:hypothetical protein